MDQKTFDTLLELVEAWAALGKDKDAQRHLMNAVYSAETLPNAVHGCFNAVPIEFARAIVPTLRNQPDGVERLERLIDQIAREMGGQHQATIQRLRDGLTQTLKEGDSFDGYKLVKRLGAGGNGTVWLAEQRMGHEGRPVAIKMLHRVMALDRFKSEMDTLAKLDHPHIVPIFAPGTVGDTRYFVMKNVQGDNLLEYCGGRPMPLERVIDWLTQMADALDYAHGRGVVHRDVKPHNMLRRTEDGHLFLADFGLVYSDSPNNPDASRPEESVGTTAYMAPEQIDSSYGEITPRTDVYALGIVGYHLLAGVVPFTSDAPDKPTQKAVIKQAHLTADLPEHASIMPEVLAILQRATAKASADRYGSAGEFVEALRDWQADPENLTRIVAKYERVLRKATKAELLEKLFVDEEGDAQTLAKLVERDRDPYDEFEEDDDDFGYDLGAIAKLHMNTEATVMTPRHEQSTEKIDNVRTHLLNRQPLATAPDEQSIPKTRIVLLGEPGSGKTWTMNLLTLDHLSAWDAVTDSTRLPVLVRLNNFKGVVRRKTDDGVDEQPETFANYVRRSARHLGPYVANLNRRGRLVLLCDALNEMPRKGPGGRDLLDEVVKYLQDAPHFVVSCRVHDYNNDLKALHPLEQVRLHELELPAIKEFIGKYLPPDKAGTLWTEMGGSDLLTKFWQRVNENGDGRIFWDRRADVPSYTSVESDEAWQAMHSGAGLMVLCRRPYTGFMVTEQYLEDGAIPSNRSALFEGFVARLLERERVNAVDKRKQTFPDFDAVKDALAQVARVLQDLRGTTLPDDSLPPDLQTDDGRVLLRAAEAASLLTYDGAVWRFTHQLLQEYFAVRLLLNAKDAGDGPETVIDGDWWVPGVWRETVTLLGETLGANEAAQWLAPYSPTLALLAFEENAEVAASNGTMSETTTAALAAGGRARTREPNPVGRAEAYRFVARYGLDERPGVGLGEDGLPDVVWCEVPGGPFLMGSDPEQDKQAQDDEQPQHPVDVAAFAIAKYAVTNVQYHPFVEGDGYTNPAYWTEAGWQEKERKGWTQPEYWDDERYNAANQPVVGVSWYEAYAYGQWLTVQLAERLPAGQVVRLARESEWEKAARGTDGQLYPYGNEYDAGKANTRDTGIGRASAVGLFEEVAAYAYEVQDMSGNTFDWCQTVWRDSLDEPEDNSAEGTALRVLRGGSFYGNDNLSRAAFRDFNLPGYRGDDSGFRLVLAAP